MYNNVFKFCHKCTVLFEIVDDICINKPESKNFEMIEKNRLELFKFKQELIFAMYLLW